MSANRKESKISPIIILFLGLMAVSTASVFIRLAQKEAPSIVVAAGRLGLASIILSPIAFWKVRKQINALDRKQWKLIILSGILLSIHFASWITSLEYTSIASSVVLVTTTPLWVALLSPILLREKLPKGIVLGLVAALFGGVVVGASEACIFSGGKLICTGLETFFTGRGMLGNFLALVGAWTAAAYLIIGRKVRGNMSLLTYIFPVYTSAAIALVIWTLISGYNFTGYSADTYLWIALLAILPQIVGHSSFNWALAYLPAAYVSIALLGEPVGTILLAILILNESPGLFEVIGGIIILTGIFQATRAQSLDAREKSRQAIEDESD
jgi:drug/metabolite transporter (DMT)-like permease